MTQFTKTERINAKVHLHQAYENSILAARGSDQWQQTYYSAEMVRNLKDAANALGYLLIPTSEWTTEKKLTHIDGTMSAAE